MEEVCLSPTSQKWTRHQNLEDIFGIRIKPKSYLVEGEYLSCFNDRNTGKCIYAAKAEQKLGYFNPSESKAGTIFPNFQNFVAAPVCKNFKTKEAPTCRNFLSFDLFLLRFKL